MDKRLNGQKVQLDIEKHDSEMMILVMLERGINYG